LLNFQRDCLPLSLFLINAQDPLHTAAVSMATGVGDEETAHLLAASRSPSPTGVITTPYQPLDHDESIDEDESDSSRTHSSEWTISQSARRLYVSHTLSTWNSRVFEFGSVLYLASIFPGTLMPLAVYSMIRGAAAIALSSWVGHYIDRNDRLKTVRLSIGKPLHALCDQ
jgi:iron-regulated transporter 1